MYCTSCGAKLTDDSIFCSECGAKVGVQAAGRQPLFGDNETDIMKVSKTRMYKKYKRAMCVAASILIIVIIGMVITTTMSNHQSEKVIQIAPVENVLYCGDTMQLTASVMSNGRSSDNKSEVIWSTSNQEIATVANDGTITAITSGNVTIKAELNKNRAVYAEAELEIVEHVKAVTIENDSMVIYAGAAFEELQLEYTISPENAYCKEVIIESSDEGVVTVDENGNVNAIASGVATIMITPVDATHSNVATCEVTVKQGVEQIVLSEHTIDAYLEDEIVLTANVFPDNADNRSVQWKSADESVATVTQDGNVTLRSHGQTLIACMAQDGSAVFDTCILTVVNPVESIELSGQSIMLLAGADSNANKKQLSYTIIPKDATYQSVVWSSSDESIAVVDANGVVTGLQSGKTTVTARTSDPQLSEIIAATCEVTVGNAVESIEFVDYEDNIAKGTVRKIKTLVLPDNAYNAKLVWKSSDESILKVDESGNVRPVGIGTAQISCTAVDGSGTYCEKSMTVYQAATSVQAEETGTTVLFEGSTTTLHANVLPSDTTNKELEWSSDNPEVATVDTSGCVSGKGKGIAMITAVTQDGSNKKCTFRICVEPAVPVTIESVGFGVYNGNLLGITVKNNCSQKAIANFKFNIYLESYTGSKLDASGSYSLGDNVYIGAGAKQTIKRTLSGIAWTQEVKITITEVQFTDGTSYSIPWLEQETRVFSR